MTIQYNFMVFKCTIQLQSRFVALRERSNRFHKLERNEHWRAANDLGNQGCKALRSVKYNLSLAKIDLDFVDLIVRSLPEKPIHLWGVPRRCI